MFHSWLRHHCRLVVLVLRVCPFAVAGEALDRLEVHRDADLVCDVLERTAVLLPHNRQLVLTPILKHANQEVRLA